MPNLLGFYWRQSSPRGRLRPGGTRVTSFVPVADSIPAFQVEALKKLRKSELRATYTDWNTLGILRAIHRRQWGDVNLALSR